MPPLERVLSLRQRANSYHQKAQWQEELRALQEALEICEQGDVPNAEQYAQEVLVELGAVRRRFGQQKQATETLERALNCNKHTTRLSRAKILGELGVVYRRCNEYTKAREAFQEQFQLVQLVSLEVEGELCRAIGNEGMSAYNMSQQCHPQDEELLGLAIRQIESRIERAQHLQQRLTDESNDTKYVTLARDWETIGLDRLTLCYIAAGQTAKAVSIAEESQHKQTSTDPTLRAFSRFFHGNALWADGQQAEALKQWNPDPGKCSPAMALCMEPSAEYLEYLQRMSSADVRFDTHDEQGFSALDYATLSDTDDAKQMIEVIIAAFRKRLVSAALQTEHNLSQAELEKKVDSQIRRRVRQADLRREYRAILQEHIRPQLRSKDDNPMAKLRKTYAQLLHEDPNKLDILDGFRSIAFQDFQKHGRLPLYGEIAARRPSLSAAGLWQLGTFDIVERRDHVVFVSYRWIGKSDRPPSDGPDDSKNTQWHRINNAVSAYLELHPGVNPKDLSLWLDWACINQFEPEEKERGIDTLPFAVTLCDAMISLVDERYYTRAWCSVECMLVHALTKSYPHHEWWEHVLEAPQSSDLQGRLRHVSVESLPDVSNLKLTEEKADRPKIDFLMRQSKLLGSDDA